MIIDNARYHHASLHEAWRQEVANHFVLHFLPPYSPQLNPIERVWKLIRRRCLHNQYLPELATSSQQSPRAFLHGPVQTPRCLAAAERCV